MRRYLVVYDHNSGMAELSNVGIFEGADEKEARLVAMKMWSITADLIAFDLDDCHDGWSYYAV